MSGRNIEGREDIVRRIAQQGHDICSHCYDHLHCRKVSPAPDFDRSDETVNQLVLDCLRSVLSAARKKGLNVLTVSELLDLRK